MFRLLRGPHGSLSIIIQVHASMTGIPRQSSQGRQSRTSARHEPSADCTVETTILQWANMIHIEFANLARMSPVALLELGKTGSR